MTRNLIVIETLRIMSGNYTLLVNAAASLWIGISRMGRDAIY